MGSYRDRVAANVERVFIMTRTFVIENGQTPTEEQQNAENISTGELFFIYSIITDTIGCE